MVCGGGEAWWEGGRGRGGVKAVVVALGYNNQIGWGCDGCMSWALLIHERICSGFESSCLVDIQMKLTFAGICMVCRWVDASE